MSIRTIIQKKFQNLFVAVVLQESECVVRCKVVQDNRIRKTFTKVFTISETNDALDSSVENYLIALQEEYMFVYVAFLLGVMGQGAFPGTTKEAFSKYSVDSDNVYSSALQKKWTTYASFIEIKWAKNLFSEVGLDLVYSPFIVLNDFVISQKIKNKPTCYVLNCQDFFVLAVFEEKNLLFGAFFKTQSDTTFTRTSEVSDWEHEAQAEGIDEEIPDLLEEEDNDGFDDLQDLSELEEIDNFQGVDTFSDIEPSKTLGHFKGEEGIREEDSNLELYGRDLLVYKYLKSSLEEYYHNPLYDSEFIEEIIIFDGYEISSELIHQLEDDLMMDVEIHKIDVSDRLCDIAIKEVF